MFTCQIRYFEFCFSFPVNGISISEKKKAIEYIILKLFLHMQVKFEIIWSRIGQVIRLQSDINFSETPCFYALSGTKDFVEVEHCGHSCMLWTGEKI